jgi:hypothetical protein
MFTDFYVLCGLTVPENYTWDLGTPLQTGPTRETAYSTVSSVSGYAPALNVIFGNNSVTDLGFDFIDYSWDFGDYYHDTTNFISLTCTSLVQHTYIMPGTYTVSLRHVQSKGKQDLDQTGASLLCRGKYGIRWFWDELGLLNVETGAPNINATTWNETECLSSKAKWWSLEEACFQKYCKAWSWYDLATNRSNPVKWSETEVDQEFQKKWMFEANDTVCSVEDAEFLNTIETVEQNVIKKFIVEVKEIQPVASMYSVSAYSGQSPHTVRLSPRNCKPGSFPIDRIDWDFGDGTPVKTVTRYAIPSGADIVNTGYFISDLNDIRNIDVLHTYKRNKNTYSIFYPSLTCFSACTNSSDSCSITIGPVTLPATPNSFHLVKNRNTLKGNIYTFSENNNISFATTTQIVTSFGASPTTPNNIIRDTKNIPQIYYGYSNNIENEIFPPQYIPNCDFQTNILPDRFLITENPVTYGALSSDVVPITTELELFITP